MDQPLDPLQSARLKVAADLSQLSDIADAYVDVMIKVDPENDSGEYVWADFHPLKNPESLAVLKQLKQAPQ